MSGFVCSNPACKAPLKDEYLFCIECGQPKEASGSMLAGTKRTPSIATSVIRKGLVGASDRKRPTTAAAGSSALEIAESGSERRLFGSPTPRVWRSANSPAGDAVNVTALADVVPQIDVTPRRLFVSPPSAARRHAQGQRRQDGIDTRQGSSSANGGICHCSSRICGL